VEVIARGSSTPYKKTTKTPKQIAQELDVKYLLTATVRWQKGTGASRVHVTPELVEVRESGAPASKWQQPFDAAITDVFQVQSEIATKVAQALGAALGAGEEKRLSEKPTENLAAYDAFLKGEEIWNTGAVDPASLRKEIGFYEQAVALDPGFAQAWASASTATSLLYSNSIPTPALAERARQSGEKAVALAPNRPEGYWALGNYERLVAGDYNRAMKQFEKGLRVAPGDTSLLRGTALVEEALGRWDAAVEHFRQAVRLDPRSVDNLGGLGDALVSLRRYPEAREAYDRGLAVAPANLSLIEGKAMAYLGEGDLAGARAVLKAAPKEVEPTALVAFVANYFELVWVLDAEQRQLLLRLTPSAFDDDPGTWALCLVQAYALKGDAANVHTYAEEARKAYEEQLRGAPNDATRHADLGLALAYLGRKEEAIREGERGVALDPISTNFLFGPYYQHQLVRIYTLVGEPEKALDQLEPLLKIPYHLSPGWLKIDPNFDPLRNNARFQKLVAGGSLGSPPYSHE
jgi:tetratricopeptide (TPR) repeat protein